MNIFKSTLIPSSCSKAPRIFLMHGFAIIELLVLLLTAGIFAGIILPAVFGEREHEGIETCRNNLRLTGSAMNMYAGDWDGWAPRSNTPNIGSWAEILMRGGYVPHLRFNEGWGDAESILVCPGWYTVQESEVYGTRMGRWMSSAAVYGMMVFEGHGEHHNIHSNPVRTRNYLADPPRANENVPNPSPPAEFLLLGDSINIHFDSFSQNSRLQAAGGASSYPLHVRHMGRANLLFADGHVESLSKAELVEGKPSWTAASQKWLEGQIY